MGEARKLADRLTDAMNDHDVEAVARCYAPDAVLTSPDGTVHGREGAAAAIGRYLTAFPDLRVTSTTKVESGATAVDEWVFTGTNTGPIETPDGQTIPPTGRAVNQCGIDIGTVEDGLITSHRIYWDQLEFLAQLGLTGQEAAA
jgi:steroid delta-isomerase-like uncharacterized protein